MEDAVHAIIMAFSVIVFVIGITVSVYMFSLITTTSENMLYFADKTNFYDNIEVTGESLTERLVDVDSIIPTLYRYYKENFCVKICDEDGDLKQIFDVNLEGKVRKAVATSDMTRTDEQKALVQVYGTSGRICNLFEAPWIGSTDENMKKRIDLYVNGQSGYINNTYVNYTESFIADVIDHNEKFPNSRILFKESFICYAYSGDTMTNDDGDILVTGAQEKDKIVITYTATGEP